MWGIDSKKMFKKKLLWYLFPSYLIIIAISLLLITWNATHAFRNFYFEKIESNQETIIKLYGDNFIDALSRNNLHKLDALVKYVSQKASVRMTVIAPDGKVLSDSQEKPSLMENHHNRPEILEALAGNTGTAIRYSNTLKENMLYVALPIIKSGKVIGIIRTALPLTLLQHNLNILYKKIFVGGIITSLFAILMSYLFSRKIQKPLMILENTALKFAEGNFSAKAPIHSTEEIGGLAEAMNIMATKLKQLENVRKDFVANVSHELKTPITSIKGFIETLQDGAIENPEEARHFLDIISRHTNRLNSIIEDLLSLSRLEQNINTEHALEKSQLYPVVKSALQVCEVNASNKSIKITLNCNEDIYAYLDTFLFEQAIINLIDNSIKYSTENKEISIIASEIEKEIVIEIKDQGVGIPEEHIPRIFERFYRVDKARSRKAGGTGLGLSIVKHIINSHKGYIAVTSRINEGSNFIIHLPREFN